MKILAVASEMQPLVKTGGLADVVGALPGALAGIGVAVTTLLPGYPEVMRRIGPGTRCHLYAALFGVKARLIRAELDGVALFVLDAPALFDRQGGPYGDETGRDFPDNWRRFAALGRAAADIAGGAVKGYRPDLVHAHDWQAAMALVYLRQGSDRPVPGVLTLHNLAFQGRFDREIFVELGLPERLFAMDGVEYHGGVGFLKAGLNYASAVTTVSPTYAEEIRTAEQGMGLDGLLRIRPLYGIVNGIDTALWDPEQDPALVARYGRTALRRRRLNRRAVEARFGLGRGPGPLFCVISRLTHQKGIDLLEGALDALMAGGGRLAVLGSGEAALMASLQAQAALRPDRVGVVSGYDESLAHLLQGGADAILIPSRFEPCGLTQLYGLRYGCLPVATRTGGLNDTIIDANEAALNAGVATGFQFWPPSPEALRHAIDRVLGVYAQPRQWAAMQRRAMSGDYSWARSAKRYAALFAGLIGNPSAAR